MNCLSFWIGQLNKQSEIKSNEFHNWFIWLIRLVWLEWNCFFLLLWLGGPSQPALSAGWKRWVMGAGTPSQQAKQKEENNGMKAMRERMNKPISSLNWLSNGINGINGMNQSMKKSCVCEWGPKEPRSAASQQLNQPFFSSQKKKGGCVGGVALFFSSFSLSSTNNSWIVWVDWKERGLLNLLIIAGLWPEAL